MIRRTIAGEDQRSTPGSRTGAPQVTARPEPDAESICQIDLKAVTIDFRRSESQALKRSWILASCVAAMLAAAAAFPSQAQINFGAPIRLGWVGYGPYWPYWYGWSGSWSPCAPGACVDNLYLRRAIQREIARLEYHS